MPMLPTRGVFIVDCILLSLGVYEYVVHTARAATSVDVLRVRVAIHSPVIAVAAATSTLERGQVVRVQGRVEVVVVV